MCFLVNLSLLKILKDYSVNYILSEHFYSLNKYKSAKDDNDKSIHQILCEEIYFLLAKHNYL